MQLLVTERIFCDFILYAENGPVSIERIFRNEQVISQIIESLTASWKRAVAPELVEMRVPRNLLPFILLEDDSCKSFISISIPYTSDEMEVANFLVNTLNTAQTCSKLIAADNEV